jgi:translation initiation factor 1
VTTFHRPFAGLGERFGLAPDEPASTPTPAPADERAPKTGPNTVIPRAVVRIEHTGRGGKEVTVVERLGLPPIERERWLTALKAALGCGGVVEGDALVLQGDHRARLRTILAARGVKHVTVAG